MGFSHLKKMSFLLLLGLLGLGSCHKNISEPEPSPITTAVAQLITVNDESTIQVDFKLTDANDVNYLYFSADANGFYAFQSTYLNDDVDIKTSYLEMALYAADGLTTVPGLSRSIEFVPTGFVFQAKDSGNYFIKVKLKNLSANSGSFSYQLKIDGVVDDEFSGNTRADTAIAVDEIPAILTGLVDLKFPDYYRFNVAEATKYTVKIANISCEKGDFSALAMVLYREDASTIIATKSEAEGESGHSCANISFTAVASETVFIEIRQVNRPLWTETYDLEISSP